MRRFLMLSATLVGICFVSFQVSAKVKIEDIEFDDSVTVSGKKLVLNGVGLRTVERFGFKIKVYVGALYLEKKSKDSDDIIVSEPPKQIVLQFVRSVDRDDLVNAFSKGYENGCVIDCANQKEQFAQLKKELVSVRNGNKMIVTTESDNLELEFTGPYAKKVKLKNVALAKNTISIFVNKKAPPTQEFRSGLLGE